MRSTIAGAVLALATLVALPALAAPAQGTLPATTHRAQAGNDKGKHFPMPAAEFQAKVDHRMARARARMEEKAATLSPDEAKELRARFDVAAQKVNAEVAKAVADGTVTKEEAEAVRAASPHHRKHARHGRKDRKAR